MTLDGSILWAAFMSLGMVALTLFALLVMGAALLVSKVMR
jgi:hypothetical protein